MITIKVFVFNPFQVNCFVVYDETGTCVIIDAASYTEAEHMMLINFIEQKSLVPTAILNTHGHVDHLLGAQRISDKYQIGLYMHQADSFLLDQAVEYGASFGFNVMTPPSPKSWLSDGEIFRFGSTKIKILSVPGHSPGSVVFYFEEAGCLITGDVLFAGSIGRTDLPGGDFNQLIHGIKTKLLILPEETRVFPGHGSETTLANEIRYNPFLNKGS